MTHRVKSAPLVLLVSSLVLFMSAPRAVAASGDLDPTFSGDGKSPPISRQPKVQVPRWPSSLTTRSSSRGGSGPAFALARYNPDGSLDDTFGTGGTVTTEFGVGTVSAAHDLAAQVDGKIVAVGWAGSSSAIARYNSDGILDTTFSGDGRQASDFGGLSPAIAEVVAIQADGKIVVAGRAGPSDNELAALARYLADGKLDTSFSGDGEVTSSFSSFFSDASDVAIQPNGAIVIVGTACLCTTDFLLARFLPNGSFDKTFSRNGWRRVDIGIYDKGNGLAIQQDGKIVAVGATQATVNRASTGSRSFAAPGREA